MGNLTWSLWYCPLFWRCLSSPCVELNDLCRGYLSLWFIKIVWKIKIFWEISASIRYLWDLIKDYYISHSQHAPSKYHTFVVMKCCNNSSSVSQHQSRNVSSKVNINMLFARCLWLYVQNNILNMESKLLHFCSLGERHHPGRRGWSLAEWNALLWYSLSKILSKLCCTPQTVVWLELLLLAVISVSKVLYAFPNTEKSYLVICGKSVNRGESLIYQIKTL